MNGDARGLLAIGTDGQPILFEFNTKTYDVEVGNVNAIGTRNVLSYGGNVRFNTFDLSIAPRGDNRTEVGGYVQDEIFLNNYVRAQSRRAHRQVRQHRGPGVLAARGADPEAARRSRACACRSTRRSARRRSINNFLETTIINQLNLGAINPALNGVIYNFPVRAIGNESLTEESTESFEVGYTGIIKNRATVSAAVYWTTNQDEIFFTQTGRYRADRAAAGMAAAAGRPRGAAAALHDAPCAPPAACRRSSAICNLGKVKNKGFELGVDGAVNQALNVFANYSYQAEPEPDFALSEINLPPTNRFNAGFNFSQGHFLGNAVGQLSWTTRSARTCSMRASPARPRPTRRSTAPSA